MVLLSQPIFIKSSNGTAHRFSRQLSNSSGLFYGNMVFICIKVAELRKDKISDLIVYVGINVLGGHCRL